MQTSQDFLSSRRGTTFVVVATAVAVLATGCNPDPSSNRDSTSDAETVIQSHIAASGAQPADAVMSLLGDTLEFPIFDDSTTAALESDALLAARRLDEEPSASNFVWMGRRLAYLWRYRRAIDVFTNGLRGYPDDPELYRHRGHRLITTRQFAEAQADLQTAADLIVGRPDEIEPDGAPNAFNRPRTTLHFNIWYHLGLAYYLQADFEKAADAFGNALRVSRNDDALVAATDWLYMSLRRNDLHDSAKVLLEQIVPSMDILENHSYHRRLMMYKGILAPDSLLSPDTTDDLEVATQGYGVGNWYLYNGHEDRAIAVFQRVVDGKYWPAFGYIAAEAELARRR